MNPELKSVILAFAREAVEAAVRGEAPPSIPPLQLLLDQGGAFVTLRTHGLLRGCIGHFTGIGSLGETIIGMAEQAALHDPRFLPVSPGELEGISIEVSVLSPMFRIDPDHVIPGVHGLYIRKGPRAGTLLPQVASEEGWSRRDFLDHTCIKAGLPPEAWLDLETEIYAYTADVIGEESD